MPKKCSLSSLFKEEKKEAEKTYVFAVGKT